MLTPQTLDLDFDQNEARTSTGPRGRVLLKLILLRALKDGCDQVWMLRRQGAVELHAHTNGTFERWVSPPDSTHSQVVEDLLDLARPKGLRAWIVRRLRSLARWIEGPWGSGHSEFYVTAGDRGTCIRVQREGEDGVVLRLEPSFEISTNAYNVLRDFVTRNDYMSRSDFDATEPTNAGLGGEVRPD